MPVSLGVGAIDLGHEVADEGLLVERREVGAQEVVASAEETVMIDLEKETFKRDIRMIARHTGHYQWISKISGILIVTK